MVRVTFVNHAQDGERFAPAAFDKVVGTRTTMRFGELTTPGTVLAAVVAPDGRSVEITVEHEEFPGSAEICTEVGERFSFIAPKPGE